MSAKIFPEEFKIQAVKQVTDKSVKLTGSYVPRLCENSRTDEIQLFQAS